jgi:hypothetical protein
VECYRPVAAAGAYGWRPQPDKFRTPAEFKTGPLAGRNCLSGRSADAAVISGGTEACRSCASASMAALTGFLCCLRRVVSAEPCYLFIASARGLGLTALEHRQLAQMRAATTAQTPGSLTA